MTVTVNGSNTATVNGVTVSNIVNTGGTITADIVAACAASDATFTLQASNGAATANATLNVAIMANSAPTLAYPSQQSVAFDGALTVMPIAASDNGSITYTVQSVSPALTTTPTIDASGVVSITNAQPAGAHTITIHATDNCGATADASFTLNVNKAGQTLSLIHI